MAAVDVISVEAAQQHLNMTGTADAAELAVHVTAASEIVEQYVGAVMIREFTDVERPGRRLVLDHRPVVELTSVAHAYGGGALNPAGLRVHPETGAVRPVSGGWLAGGPYDVTYRAGRAATVRDVPAALALATRVIVAHLWETQRGATLGPGMTPADDFTPAPQGAGFAVPYRARDLMGPYRSTVVV